MITNIISQAYLASALDRQRAATLGIAAERDELLAALKALYAEAMKEWDYESMDKSDPMVAALMAARLAILRAEEERS